ncbi:tRNA (adenosine(37)-N6)-threonylcarbamoyltransferase complex transferase subunit TsaD [Balneolales bacterium ANBcel1]|nr:tRNA (adenosine(37)-N6)-threonylcarbamoyltransferase complex transferase subunit TsaD [Balneolales bacterium ANBcel1]
MTILGIESSCDETAAAVYDGRLLRSSVIASQKDHAAFGGIVPELASRAHERVIWDTVLEAMARAEVTPDDIDAIAVTEGPGLMGSLLVGLCFAKGLSIQWNKPVIGVNHIDAHIYATFIDEKPELPFVSLVVSGGHTQIFHVRRPLNHILMGQTRDDAAGEAFDKIGKLLGLDYPAGPRIDQLAASGDSDFFDFPRAMMKKGLDFSFSGLKTSVLYYIQSIPENRRQDFLIRHLNDLCASISAAITDVLIHKLRKAIRETGVSSAIIAGGVSANSMLREKARKMAADMGVSLHIPHPKYCTDNAAMIAVTGWFKAGEGMLDDLTLKPYARHQWEKVS